MYCLSFQYLKGWKPQLSVIHYRDKFLLLGMLLVILMESSCNTLFKEPRMEAKIIPTFITRVLTYHFVCTETPEYSRTQITAIVLWQ